MNYYVGVDIGTTATKTVAFSNEGKLLARFAVDYSMHHPQPGYREQDPDEILDAVIHSIRQVLQTLTPHFPSCISFSAPMHSLILMDENSQLLTRCIIWADNRATAIAEKLKNSREGKIFYHSTGVPLHPMSPLCKLLWFKENQPQLFDAAAKFIGIKEYVFYKLFGQFLIDTSVASATGLLNIHTLQWDEQIFQYVGVKPGRLSDLVSTKQICYYKNNYPKLLLPDNTVFVVGSSDGALSNLGSGAAGNHTMAISIGTSSAVRRMLTAPETDENMRTFCYHVNEKNYIVGGASNNGAVVLQWLKDYLLQASETYEMLFELAATIEPGCEGLLLLPYILGERAPLWNAKAKAVYFGLSIGHTKAHLIRAALEGVVYNVYSIGKLVDEAKQVKEIFASGGFVKNALWLQMLSDMFNTNVLVSAAEETVALGAVMVGAEALHLKTDFQNNALTTYYPDEQNHQLYKQRFQKFERLYELLKNEMSDE